MIGAIPRREIVLPYPHPGQQRVRREAKRFNWLAAGRRWRKTTLAMSIAVEEALRGKRIIWGAPTYDQVRVAWQESKHAAGGVALFQESRMTALWPRGGVILFRSLDDPNNARGHTADGAIVDEAGDVRADAWYEVLRPMLLDTGGWAWCVGTPRGRNWFWIEHQRALDLPDSAVWQAPTLGVRITEAGLVREPHPLENPHVALAEIEQLWRTMPERSFRQEILAEFVEDGGGVFRRVREAAQAEPQAQAQAGHAYVIGVDWGKYDDFTVLAVVDCNINELVALDRFNQVDYAIQVGRLRALYERFRPWIILAEQNAAGEPIIEQLQRQGLPVWPFLTTHKSKTEAIDTLALAFEQQALKILPEPVLIAELEAYEAQRLPSGALRYGAPAGLHDDCVMALALAWFAASQPRPRITRLRWGGRNE